MCNFNPNRDAEIKLMSMGLSLISTAIEASLRENNPTPSTDVLAIATQAYHQGKITKTQFMGVINALDEQSYQKTPCDPNHPNNRAYLEAKAYLDQYRG